MGLRLGETRKLSEIRPPWIDRRKDICLAARLVAAAVEMLRLRRIEEQEPFVAVDVGDHVVSHPVVVVQRNAGPAPADEELVQMVRPQPVLRHQAARQPVGTGEDKARADVGNEFRKVGLNVEIAQIGKRRFRSRAGKRRNVGIHRALGRVVPAGDLAAVIGVREKFRRPPRERAPALEGAFDHDRAPRAQIVSFELPIGETGAALDRRRSCNPATLGLAVHPGPAPGPESARFSASLRSFARIAAPAPCWSRGAEALYEVNCSRRGPGDLQG